MVGSFALVSRNKYQSFSQKVSLGILLVPVKHLPLIAALRKHSFFLTLPGRSSLTSRFGLQSLTDLFQLVQARVYAQGPSSKAHRLTAQA